MKPEDVELPDRYWSAEQQRWVYPGERPEPAAWKFRRFLEHRESLEFDRPSEHDGEVTPLYTADQVREAIEKAVAAAVERCALVCEGLDAGVGYEQTFSPDQCAAAIRSMK